MRCSLDLPDYYRHPIYTATMTDSDEPLCCAQPNQVNLADVIVERYNVVTQSGTGDVREGCKFPGNHAGRSYRAMLKYRSFLSITHMFGVKVGSE